MVVPVWAEPLARCYSTIMVLLPDGVSLTSAHLMTAFVDIATSGRLSDTYRSFGFLHVTF